MAKESSSIENIEKALEEDIQTSEEAMAKAIRTLSKTEYPQQLTEINREEVKLLTRIHALGEIFACDELKRLANHFEFLMVSNSRKGRNEILAIGKSAREDMERKSKLSRLLTLGRGSI